MQRLLKLFSSKVRIKLLNAFLSLPDARFYVRELARKTEEDISNIHKELRNLETLGLLNSKIRGNLKFYSVNKDFFLYPELKEIIFKTTGIHGLLKEALNGIEEVEAAFIYGPYATGKEHEERSEVDVMIIGHPDLTKINGIISDLEKKINREINYMCFSRVEFEDRKKDRYGFIVDVLQGKKIMLKGSEDAV